MSVTKGFVNNEAIDKAHVLEVATRIRPVLVTLAGKDDSSMDFLLQSTIRKVLVYINSLILPEDLEDIIVEMCARQLVDYEGGLTSEKGEGAVKKVQRGGFSQEFETKQASSSIPRGTQLMQDYAKYLNRYRKMRTV